MYVHTYVHKSMTIMSKDVHSSHSIYLTMCTLLCWDSMRIVVFILSLVGLSLQAKNFSLVLDVLTRFKAADIEKTVKGLSSEEIDVLMKYIYRGFAEPTENSCGVLLSWHQQVCPVCVCVCVCVCVFMCMCILVLLTLLHL